MRTARPPFPRRAMKSYGRERIRTREALESSASSVSCHCPAHGLLVQTARPPLPRLCPPPPAQPPPTLPRPGKRRRAGPRSAPSRSSPCGTRCCSPTATRTVRSCRGGRGGAGGYGVRDLAGTKSTGSWLRLVRDLMPNKLQAILWLLEFRIFRHAQVDRQLAPSRREDESGALGDGAGGGRLRSCRAFGGGRALRKKGESEGRGGWAAWMKPKPRGWLRGEERAEAAARERPRRLGVRKGSCRAGLWPG